MKKRIIVLLLIVSAVFSVFAEDFFMQSNMYSVKDDFTYCSQLGLENKALDVPSNSRLLALSDSSYPVTPGDIYTLTYSDGRDDVVLELQVDGSCNISIPLYDKVNVKGYTFETLKEYVENLIAATYVYSSPVLTLKSCGVFRIYVTGEVSSSCYAECWGLSRLSDLAYLAGKFASTRCVNVKYADGTVVSYDLYSAIREGASAQNPRLTASCEVEFTKAKNFVVLDGSVYRPGVYQVSDADSLETIINRYGKGLLKEADKNKISIGKYFADGSFRAKTVKYDENDFVLTGYDFINVASVSQSLPFAIVEGAIDVDGEKATQERANRLLFNFCEGETAEDLVRALRGRFGSNTDTDAIYLVKADGRTVSIDGSRALSSDYSANLLEQGDKLVVPFSKQSVMVTGSVVKPGSYSYIPDKDVQYYINLAGGFSSSSRQKEVKVFKSSGDKVRMPKLNTPVGNDYVIEAVTATGFSRDIPRIAAILGLLSTVAGIVYNLK